MDDTPEESKEESEAPEASVNKGASTSHIPNHVDPAGGKAEKKPMRLGEQLIHLGLISEDQLQIVLTEQKVSKKMINVNTAFIILPF